MATRWPSWLLADGPGQCQHPNKKLRAVEPAVERGPDRGSVSPPNGLWIVRGPPAALSVLQVAEGILHFLTQVSIVGLDLRLAILHWVLGKEKKEGTAGF